MRVVCILRRSVFRDDLRTDHVERDSRMIGMTHGRVYSTQRLLLGIPVVPLALLRVDRLIRGLRIVIDFYHC